MNDDRVHAERVQSMREEFERADAQAKSVPRLLAPAFAVVAIVLIGCAVATVVGLTWWVLTGRPMFGG